MNIELGAKLFGDDWSKFRIFGTASGDCDSSQKITINPYDNTALATVEPNLQKAFLWLKTGKLKYETSRLLTRIPDLVGSACKFESSVVAPANLTTLSNRKFFEGLGGAYDFNGVFGQATPIRFFYRGYGFSDQSISPSS